MTCSTRCLAGVGAPPRIVERLRMSNLRFRLLFFDESCGTRIPPADGMIGLLGETEGLLKHRRLAFGGVERGVRFLIDFGSFSVGVGLGSWFSGVSGS